MSTLLLLGLGLAVAAAPEEETLPATAPPPEASDGSHWGWAGLPYASYNSIDGLGVGLGAEVFERPAGTTSGFRYKATLSTFFTVTGNYSSTYLQLMRQDKHPWVARLVYRYWKNLIYVGAGGDDVVVRWASSPVAVDDPQSAADDRANADARREFNQAYRNEIYTPSALFGVSRSIRNTPLLVWGQAYTRFATVEPHPGGMLHQEKPLGADCEKWRCDSLYTDFSLGLFLSELDRFPLPNRGIRSELDTRVGFTVANGEVTPLVGLHAEVMGWVPLYGSWLVLGARSVFDKTWGQRPFYEQEQVGGQWRDEVGYEQPLTGYARTRSRGDGLWATLVEVRPKIFDTQVGRTKLEGHLSLFAEAAWLFEGNDPGPALPSLGLGPELLYQGAVQVRPFLSFGWMRDDPGDIRKPTPQFNLSLMGPL
ncbi:MAG: hypothetical protein ACON5B_03635 [Myxococcota bacterium]